MSYIHEINKWMKEYEKVGSATEKGDIAENMVYRICEEFYKKQGGILMHSYSHKVDKNLKGNIKRKGDVLYIENLGSFTEIDVLLVTPYRIFPIEVKAYSSKKIVLTDKMIQGVFADEKSPVHQNEMHCRHLYSWLYKCIPEGKTEYIKPLVVFADRCVLDDQRSDWQKEYIPVCLLNDLEATILRLNKPGKYRLDLTAVNQALRDCAMGEVKKMSPLKIK